MDIKTLLKKDSAELELMGEAQIKEYFEPYLKFIRPIKEEEKKAKTDSRQRFDTGREAQRTLQMAQELAKKFGIKL